MAQIEMTRELAQMILKHYNISCAEFLSAKKYMEENYPGDDSLAIAKEREDEYRTENNLEGDKEDIYENNIASLNEHSEKYTYEKIANDEEVKNFVDRVVVCEQKGKKPAELSAEQKSKYLDVLFEAAKLEAELLLAGDKNYAAKSRREQEDIFEEHTKTSFVGRLGQTAMASSIKKPTRKESVVGSKAHELYQRRENARAQAVLEDAVHTDKPIFLNTDCILTSVANTANKAETYTVQLREKAKGLGTKAHHALTQLSVYFENKKNKMEKKADTVSKGRYSKLKRFFGQLKTSARDNIFQIGGSLAATAGFALATGVGGVPLATAAMGYGAYHAVSSWIWPIVAERRKIARIAKEKNQKINKKAIWKQAFKQATSKKEGAKVNSYVVNGTVNTIVGLAGGAALAHYFDAASAVKGATEAAVSTRFAMRAGRALTPAAAQLTDAGVSYLIDPNDKNNVAYAKQKAKVGLLSGALGAAIVWGPDGWHAITGGNDTPDLAAGNQGLPDTNIEDVNAGSNPVDTEFTDPIASDIYFDDNSLAPEICSKDGITVIEDGQEVFLSRKEYAESLGVSERYYTWLHGDPSRNIEGVLSEEGYKHAWMKLSQNGALDKFNDMARNDMFEHAKADLHMSEEDALGYVDEHFHEMSKEEIITKYTKLYGFTRKAGLNLIAGEEIGLDAFHDKANPEAMASTYNFLFCDKDISTVDASAGSHIQNAESFMTEYANDENHNRFVYIQTKDPCNGHIGNGSRWVGQTPQPEPEPEPEFYDEIEEPESYTEEEPRKVVDEEVRIEPLKRRVATPKIDPKGRMYVGEFDSDDYNHVAGEKTISDEEAAESINRLNGSPKAPKQAEITVDETDNSKTTVESGDQSLNQPGNNANSRKLDKGDYSYKNDYSYS